MKLITRDELIAANNEAIRLEFNCAIREELLEALPANAIYPVRLMLRHVDFDGNRSYRVMVILNGCEMFALLDLTGDVYFTLPEWEVSI